MQIELLGFLQRSQRRKPKAVREEQQYGKVWRGGYGLLRANVKSALQAIMYGNRGHVEDSKQLDVVG